MTIIISKNGAGATRVRETGVSKELHLETYVAANPETLPLDDIREELKLVTLGQQFPTESGPIDVIAVDDQGELYLIETKLFRNPDKRQVIAQVLDYGAALWRSYRDGTKFLADLEMFLAGRGAELGQRLQEGLGCNDEEVGAVKETIAKNVESGNLRFIILMDALHDRLRDLILFLNERSRFVVYAVEMRFYRYEGWEIVIPKIFGAEGVAAPANAGGRRRWDEKKFFSEVDKNLDAGLQRAIHELYEFAKSSGADVRWGTGVIHGSFNPRYPHLAQRSLFTVSSDGNVTLNFKWLADNSDVEAFRDRYADAVQRSGFCEVPSDYRRRFITAPDGWHNRVDRYIVALRPLLAS